MSGLPGTGLSPSKITGAIDAQASSTVSAGLAGQLAITGNALLENASTLSLSIAKSGVHSGQQPDLTDYSQLSIGGAGTIDGSTLALNVGSGIEGGDIFVIILSGAPVTGTFAGLPNLTTFIIGSQEFEINYAYNPAGGFADTTGTDVALLAVPEPGTLVSLLGGVGMLAGLRRFCRR